MLDKIFEMQAKLNDLVFEKNNIKDDEGHCLLTQKIMADIADNKIKANDLPNHWLGQYAMAMRAELDELDEELLWKWWSKDEIDLQNIRVELIDILHFLVSAMMCSGLSADKVFDIYQKKYQVNIDRQNKNYSQATKTEDDNKTIK